MKKLFLLSIGFLGTFFVQGCVEEAVEHVQDNIAEFTVVNSTNSRSDIVILNARVQFESTWGENLANVDIPPGESLRITVACDKTYDFRAIFDYVIPDPTEVVKYIRRDAKCGEGRNRNLVFSNHPD
jgi:hypothetical protein